MKRRLTALVAAAGLAITASGCGISLQSLPKVGGMSGPTYPIDATFANVLNLPADAQVRVGAETVGEVRGISARGFSARVVLAIKRGVRLPQGTTAEVRFDNPLGDEYVLLQPPVHGGPLLRAGSQVPESLTSTAPSVEDTFGALSLVLNGGGLEQLQTVIHELNDTFAGNQPQIHALLGDINSTVTTVAGGRAAVDNALTAIQGLSRQLNKGSSTITGGIAAAAPAVTVLAQANGDLNDLLTSFQQLSKVGLQVADQSGPDAVADAKALLPVAQQLQMVDSQLGPDLQLIGSFEHETPKIAPGDYLQVSVVANVVLPQAPSDATIGPTGTSAIDDLLIGGLR